ncbi:MAG: hypothetical protein AB7E36_05730 [Salinivirgaceae bacterium]
MSILRRFFPVSFVLIFVFSQHGFSQSYVADTIRINFDDHVFKKFHSGLSATDYREENPHFISVFEKKKWLAFPVDQIVSTTRTLSRYFENPGDTLSNKHYQLSIHDFYINYNESLFKRFLKLNAYIGLSEINKASDTTYLGIFYYEQSDKFNKKDSLRCNYQTVWNSFSTQFYADLSVITSDSIPGNQPFSYHFNPGQKPAPKNFYVSLDSYYGYTFWGIDAEIYFAAPEMAQKFTRNTRMFRYLNYGNRQSVAFSTQVYQFNYRLNEHWLFQNKHGFIFGLNKWNDVDEAKRTFEELFMFQYAFSQRLTYNPLNKNGLTFGIGLMEEASYIIYNEPVFSVALLINCAYKF